MIIINFSEKLCFNDWRQPSFSKNWIRDVYPFDGFSGILLMETHILNSEVIFWKPHFLGKTVNKLKNYCPTDWLKGFPFSEEGKKKIDKFLTKFNKIKIFG